MATKQHTGTGENAPPPTARERKAAEMKANAYLMCTVQPNADGRTLNVEVARGAIGAEKVLASGSLPIETYKTQTAAEGFRKGEYHAEGTLTDPKTGITAGRVDISGPGMNADYSCLFKSAAEGATVQSADLLTRAPAVSPAAPLPAAAPKAP